MYIDTSLRKIGVILAIVIILWGAVATTFALKDKRFGSTPFYAAAGLALQESAGRVFYSIEYALRALFAGSRDEVAPGNAAGIPVLTYHRLVFTPDGVNVTVGDFKDQMEALKAAGWQTITLGEFMEFMRGGSALPERSVLITFDDGAKQSFYTSDPILDVLGFNAVNYIIVTPSQTPESTYYLSSAEIKRMLSSGRWEIGSHSYDGHHPSPVDAAGETGNFFADKLWVPAAARIETTAEFRARVAEDLRDSRAALEKTYGVTVDTFAYPFGETGLHVFGNFPAGVGITDEEAARVYELGWLQNERGDYTFNYPDGDAFIAQRIHVEAAWNGADLLDHLEKGMGKTLPYTDTLESDRGWRPTWGTVAQESGVLLVRATPQTAGASTFLDGTKHWHDYQYEATLDWKSGYAMLAGNMVNGSTYRLCSFTDGNVRLQEVVGETRRLLGEADVPALRRGNDVRLGIRIEGTSTSCLWNGRAVLSVGGLRRGAGGIGLQTWDTAMGVAALTVKNISVARSADVPAPPRLSTQTAAPPAQGFAPIVEWITTQLQSDPQPVIVPEPEEPPAPPPTPPPEPEGYSSSTIPGTLLEWLSADPEVSETNATTSERTRDRDDRRRNRR